MKPNLELTTRPLTKDDRRELIEFWKSNRPLWKKTEGFLDHSGQGDLPERLAEIALHPDHLTMGCFDKAGEESRLCFTLSARRWTNMASYTLRFASAGAAPLPSPVLKRCLQGVFKYLIPAMEAERRFTFFYVTLAHYIKERDRTSEFGSNLMQKIIPELRRYDFGIESYVPAGTKPDFQLHYDLLDRRLHDQDLCIRRAMLRSKYATELLLSPRT